MARENDCIKKTLELAVLMLSLADEGDSVRKDVGCGVLYGVLRDSAYRIKNLAEAERRPTSRKAVGNTRPKEPSMQDYQCGICGYLYEPANGDPGANIPPTRPSKISLPIGPAPSVGPGRTSSRRSPDSRRPGKTVKSPERLNLTNQLQKC